MKRVGFVLKVRQDHIARYKEFHRNVWPEMQEALRRNGWNNYSLFMRDDGLMFGYFEASVDFNTSLEGMSKEEINSDWQKLMSEFFEIPDGSAPDEMMIQLEEVFHLEELRP